MSLRNGLILTGGGARGAYQAGALLALSEILRERELPFPVLSGASAGSINAVYLAARADDFPSAARDLFRYWSELKPDNVFRTDAATLARIGIDWVADLGFGAWIGTGRGRSLLDTAPLRGFLETHLDIASLHRHVLEGRVHGIAVTATNYSTGRAVIFFEGDPAIREWARTTRVALRDQLTITHVLASAAIPVFFPAVELRGEFYADGCIRMNSPLSPAIHLGAKRLLAIGVRHPTGIVSARTISAEMTPHPYPSPAETAGVLLNALFLDALDADIERVERINRTLHLIPPDVLTARDYELRNVPVMRLCPSQDLGTLATQTVDHLPYMVRHFLRGLGASHSSGWDLVSYLAFDGEYTRRLLDLGYQDAFAQRESLLSFLT